MATTTHTTTTTRERAVSAALAAERRVCARLIPARREFDPEALRAALLAWKGPAR